LYQQAVRPSGDTPVRRPSQRLLQRFIGDGPIRSEVHIGVQQIPIRTLKKVKAVYLEGKPVTFDDPLPFEGDLPAINPCDFAYFFNRSLDLLG
jgi:hypothetical protein